MIYKGLILKEKIFNTELNALRIYIIKGFKKKGALGISYYDNPAYLKTRKKKNTNSIPIPEVYPMTLKIHGNSAFLSALRKTKGLTGKKQRTF